MRSKKQITARIAEIKKDPRFSYPPAQVQVNAPLALIQVEMKSRVEALEWVLEHSCEKECDLTPEELELLEQKKVIGCIKLVRDRLGGSLIEAKKIVDAHRFKDIGGSR